MMTSSSKAGVTLCAWHLFDGMSQPDLKPYLHLRRSCPLVLSLQNQTLITRVDVGFTTFLISIFQSKVVLAPLLTGYVVGEMEAICNTYYGQELGNVVEPAGVFQDLEVEEA